jgi:tetratricopeptide (TPR) repeat protein
MFLRGFEKSIKKIIIFAERIRRFIVSLQRENSNKFNSLFMFNILKKDIKVDDKVKFYLTTGKEQEGTVGEIGENSVLLETDDKIKIRIFDKLIGGWEVLSSKIQPVTITAVVPEKRKTEGSKKITDYTVGEVVPLDLLNKVTGNKSRFPKTKSKPASTFKSFDALEQLVDSENQEANKQLVSANGVITKYSPDKNSGFITDQSGGNLYFQANDVVDNGLHKQLEQINEEYNIPVLFTSSKNSTGDVAILIQKPKTIQKILESVNKFIQENDMERANGLLEQILFSYPENSSATRLKDEIIAKNKKKQVANKFVTYDFYFQKAVKAKSINKDFDSALKYYRLAFENYEKRESCIKDIGMLHVQMQESQEAIDFINKYKHELPDNITTYNYLANFYSAVKEFDKAIEYVDLLIENRTIQNNKQKYSNYLSHKGYILIQIKQIDEARKILNDAIAIYPENISANRLLQSVGEPDKKVSVETSGQQLEDSETPKTDHKPDEKLNNLFTKLSYYVSKRSKRTTESGAVE